MKKYKHLTASQRDKLAVWRIKKVKMNVCAQRLGVSKSTISRELKRNTKRSNHRKQKYLANTAQQLYKNRRLDCKPKLKLHTNPKLKKEIILKLQKGWSPETIVGRMKEVEKRKVVCHETIYKFIYESEEGKTNKFFEYLALGKRRRTSWKGRRSKTEKLVGRKFIDQRPKEVDERKEFGHFETDSIVFKGHKPLNVLVERKSRKVFVNKLPSFESKHTMRVIVKTLKHLKPKSITGDNGIEFAKHKKIEKKLKTDFYFCFPYHSWEKGTVENRNRQLRKYLPSKTYIRNTTRLELFEITEYINDTPLKILGYLTPNEVYSRESCTRN